MRGMASAVDHEEGELGGCGELGEEGHGLVAVAAPRREDHDDGFGVLGQPLARLLLAVVLLAGGVVLPRLRVLDGLRAVDEGHRPRRNLGEDLAGVEHSADRGEGGDPAGDGLHGCQHAAHVHARIVSGEPGPRASLWLLHGGEEEHPHDHQTHDHARGDLFGALRVLKGRVLHGLDLEGVSYWVVSEHS